ncbi:MAG: DNA translocase FtsK 4TM domain-containing protein, partial [Brevefilum sp.]
MARRKTKKTASKKPGRRTSQTKTQKPLLESISPQRRKDIFAILLILLGVLTLVSLLTQSSGSIIAWWVNVLGWVFGWGTYLLPILWIGIGGWILLRSFDRTPKMTAERVIGIVLLFINLLAWFHFLINGGRPQPEILWGGGFIGDLIENALVTGLGRPGTAIALIAWFLISLVFALDLTMISLLRWANKAVNKFFKTILKWIRILIEKFRKNQPAASTKDPASIQSHSEIPQSTPEKLDNAPVSEGEGDPNSLYYNQMAQQPVWVLPDPNEILD